MVEAIPGLPWRRGRRRRNLSAWKECGLVEAALGSELAVEALLVSESGERTWRLSDRSAAELQILRTTDRLLRIADTQSRRECALSDEGSDS